MSSYCPKEGHTPSKQRDPVDEILKRLSVPAVSGVLSTTRVFGERSGSSTVIEILPFSSPADDARNLFHYRLLFPLFTFLLRLLHPVFPAPDSHKCCVVFKSIWGESDAPAGSRDVCFAVPPLPYCFLWHWHCLCPAPHPPAFPLSLGSASAFTFPSAGGNWEARSWA